MGNYHATFCRAVEGATLSLTLILIDIVLKGSCEKPVGEGNRNLNSDIWESPAIISDLAVGGCQY